MESQFVKVVYGSISYSSQMVLNFEATLNNIRVLCILSVDFLNPLLTKQIFRMSFQKAAGPMLSCDGGSSESVGWLRRKIAFAKCVIMKWRAGSPMLSSQGTGRLPTLDVHSTFCCLVSFESLMAGHSILLEGTVLATKILLLPQQNLVVHGEGPVLGVSWLLGGSDSRLRGNSRQCG